MPKFRMNSWLQLNNIGFPLIVTLWLLMTTIFEEIYIVNLNVSMI